MIDSSDFNSFLIILNDLLLLLLLFGGQQLTAVFLN